MNAEAILANFTSSIEKQRTAHAYLINGPVRGGSMSVAQEMAKKILCEHDQEGCGKCVSCGKVDGRSHPDFIWIEPRMKSRQISIAEIRELQHMVHQTAYMGEWKVCVIAGADRMAAPAANALLKSLEEPPAKCMFILLAENPQYLLPTIISRCHRLELSTQIDPSAYEWYGQLMDILGASSSGTVARMATSYGLVALLKDMKGGIEVMVQEEDDFSEDIEDKVLDARIMARYREERAAVMRMLLLWYRDILVLVSGAGDDAVYHSEHLESLKRVSAGLSVREATANIEIVEEMAQLLERHLGEDSVFLDGFARLVEAA